MARNTHCELIETLENRQLASASPLGAGGFTGTYFDSYNLTTPVATRVDPVILFRFGRKSPVPAIIGDTFSAKWQAQLTPVQSGAYAFVTGSDDGVRVLVDGTPKVDAWNAKGLQLHGARVNLSGGTSYTIEMDYHHTAGPGVVGLLWGRRGGKLGFVGGKVVTPTPPTTGSSVPPVDVTVTPPVVAPVIPPVVAPVIPPVVAPVVPPVTAPVVPPVTNPVPPTTPVTSPVVGNGTVWTVDPNGALNTIGKAVAKARAGDTIVVLAGTYHESINMTTSGTASEPITLEAATAGSVIIDGSGFSTVINSNGAQTSFINLIGLTVQNCANAAATDPGAVVTGDGWNLSNMTVDAADGTGIMVFGSNVTLTDVTAENCGRAGLSGNGCDHVLVKDCVTVGNNTKGNDPDFDGGAGKWLYSDHVTIDGLVSHDNIGPGVWFDTDNTNAVIENCTIYDNKGLTNPASGSGIRFEQNTGQFTVENNTLYGNTGANLEVASCRNVLIENNHFTGTSLTLLDWPRGDDYTMQNITIKDNVFDHCGIATQSDNWDDSSPAVKNIAIDGDQFVGSNGAVLVQWGSQTFTSLSSVHQALGLEVNGTWVLA